MPLYMYQAAYSAESLAAMIRSPQTRIEVVTPALEAIAGKILVAGCPSSQVTLARCARG